MAEVKLAEDESAFALIAGAAPLGGSSSRARFDGGRPYRPFSIKEEGDLCLNKSAIKVASAMLNIRKRAALKSSRLDCATYCSVAS